MHWCKLELNYLLYTWWIFSDRTEQPNTEPDRTSNFKNLIQAEQNQYQHAPLLSVLPLSHSHLHTASPLACLNLRQASWPWCRRRRDSESPVPWPIQEDSTQRASTDTGVKHLFVRIYIAHYIKAMFHILVHTQIYHQFPSDWP